MLLDHVSRPPRPRPPPHTTDTHQPGACPPSTHGLTGPGLGVLLHVPSEFSLTGKRDGGPPPVTTPQRSPRNQSRALVPGSREKGQTRFSRDKDPPMSWQLHRRGSRPPGSWRVGPAASTWPRPACHPLGLPPVPFSEGTPCQRGPREPGVGSGAPRGSLAKALAPQSQAVGVRPCLFGPQSVGWRTGPSAVSPMPCMGPTSGQRSLGEGEPGICPHPGGAGKPWAVF